MARLLISGSRNLMRQSCYTNSNVFKFLKTHRAPVHQTQWASSQIKTLNTTGKWCVSFFGAGLGVIITSSLRRQKNEVQCEANRLVGFSTQEKAIKFNWAHFWYYLKPYLAKLFIAIICSLAVAYFNIQIPTYLGTLVNVLTKYTNAAGNPFEKYNFFAEIRKPSTNLFGMYVLQSFLTFLYIHLLSQIGEQMGAKIRQDLYQQIVIQDMSFFDKHRTGELVNRLSVDVQEFKHCFKQFVSVGLRSLAQLVGGTVSLYLISPQLATIALLSVPSAVMFGTLLGKSLRNISKKSQTQSEKATAVCEEAISNIRAVRASASETYEIQLFEKETHKAALLAQQLGLGIGLFQALTNLFLNSMVLSTLSLGGYFMSNDSITAGQLMSFLVASQVVQRSLAQGSMLLGTMVRGITAGARVFEFILLEPTICLDKGVEFDIVGGKIVFENVSFAYPSRPEQLVLKNFSVTLEPGQSIALVGESGSGKSTVAALLERFYEPSSGNIYIDGVNLNTVKPDWLRKHVIGFVEQQPILFGTSILENIRYARPECTEDEVRVVAKAAQCHEFIENMPDGYQTLVGERGIQLSGGQRQRIAIARTLLKNPKILILDEATSALDANSESIVQQALDHAAKTRTSLIIAHRLSTVKNANHIVVLCHGKIVESGTHEQLMTKKGAYFDLVNQQDKTKNASVRAQG